MRCVGVGKIRVQPCKSAMGRRFIYRRSKVSNLAFYGIFASAAGAGDEA
jgi:hypothetical protein